MTITFITHSCFVVENEDVVIVFDYWKDTPDGRLHRKLKQLYGRQLYVVCSHFHEDHYSPEVLEWEAKMLVSYDTQKRRRIPKETPAMILRPGDTYQDEHIRLRAFRSTDVGISSLVTLSDGQTVYHSGDNNNWYFSNDPQDHIRCTLEEMEGIFISTVNDVRTACEAVDHVMFPVDPRLGDDMLRGAFQWLRYIDTKHFYPMHCWERWEEVRDAVSQIKELFPEVDFVLPSESSSSYSRCYF